MEEFTDYYEILGIEYPSSEDEIKKTYRKLISRYHPDINKSKEAQEKSRKINEAYDVLGNKNTKEEYDKKYMACKEGKEIPVDDTITDDEVHKYYSEKEREIAQKLQLQSEIKQELDKISSIFGKKNEILYVIIQNHKTFDIEEYRTLVTEFIGLVREYIVKISAYIEKTIEFGLTNEEYAIKSSIEILEEMINTLPETPKAAYDDFKDKQYKEYIQNEIEKEISTAKDLINELESILMLSYQNEISKIEYPSYMQNAIVRSKDCVKKLGRLSQLQMKVFRPEKSEINTVMGKLDFMILLMPTDYANARILGEYLCENDTDLINSMITEMEQKVDTIINNGDNLTLSELTELLEEVDNLASKIKIKLNEYENLKISRFNCCKERIQLNEIMESGNLLLKAARAMGRESFKLQYFEIKACDLSTGNRISILAEKLEKAIQSLSVIGYTELAKEKFLEAQQYLSLLYSLKLFAESYGKGQNIQKSSFEAAVAKIVEYRAHIQERETKVKELESIVNIIETEYKFSRTISSLFTGVSAAASVYPIIELTNGKEASPSGIFLTGLLTLVTLLGSSISIGGWNMTKEGRKEYKSALKKLKRVR